MGWWVLYQSEINGYGGLGGNHLAVAGSIVVVLVKGNR